MQFIVHGGAIGGRDIEFSTATGIKAVIQFVSKEVTNTVERFSIQCKSVTVEGDDTYTISYYIVNNGVNEHLETRDTCDTFTSTVNLDYAFTDTIIQYRAVVWSSFAYKIYEAELLVKPYTPTTTDI